MEPEKIQAVKITACLEKGRFTRNQPYISVILLKPFSFWTSLPSFWLPFLTPFKVFSSFSRAENFFRAPKAPLSCDLLLLSKNLARER